MTKERLQHILTLLGSLALAVLPLWADASVPLAAKLAGSISTVLALVFSLAKMRQYGNVIFGLLSLAAGVATIMLGKLSGGTTAAVIVGTLLATITNLRAILARDLGEEKASGAGKLLALTIAFLGATALATPAQAQDAAPFAGKCFGAGTSTCLVPQLSFDVTRVRLNGPDAGSLVTGAVPLGAGYALLFGYDQWWASGPAVHGILDLSQGGPNFFQLAGMATVFRYVHVGVIWSRLGGSSEWFAAGGLTLPIDVVTTAVAERKARAVRAARGGGQ